MVSKISGFFRVYNKRDCNPTASYSHLFAFLSRLKMGKILILGSILPLIQLEGDNWIAAGAKNPDGLFCEE
ncbi:hypothetical protein PAHAL_7G129400 [Panicum hallii]|jgi:hypothetical protein|uniref:Uncharacterized protein n=1 Tax=Panicum hallii TaxID=206008 RepID=A0A2T8IC22_9POAL|nr:hypothetical protein PAHAL_7G129400 [Panicum hallii]